MAALAWRVALPAIDAALENEPKWRVSLFDNSVGCGRLFQFADPDRHTLAGCDPHAPSIERLAATAEDAGFHVDFLTCGMEAARATNFNVGLLNPPFSLHLESPLLEPFGATTMGAYGPSSSATSHAYALDQALAACEVVVAILPESFVATLTAGSDHHRLRAILHLPAGSFREEGTEVRVSIAVYGPKECSAPLELSLSSLDDALPNLGLLCGTTLHNSPRLCSAHVKDDAPVITLPVTGDRTVRIAHDGRKLRFLFNDGLVEARVLNALMARRLEEKRPDEGRYPRGIRYKGQGVYDLELHLAQPDPIAAFADTVERVRAAGGEPEVDPGILGYLRRRHRRIARQRTPYQRVAWVKGPAESGPVRAIARRPIQCNPKKWGSGVFRAGDVVEFSHDGGTFRATHPVTGEVLALEGGAFEAAFEVEGGQGAAGWRVVHPGRAAKFPNLAKLIRQQLDRRGLGRITSWDFQIDDLVELRLAPHGVVGWTMGLGKTRAALGLCLSGGRHNLIVVEAHLVDELVDQIEEVGLSPTDWQVIESPAQCERLRSINIISYTRLRMPVCPGAGRRTYASRLRRRIHTLIADEAHLLRSPDTEQTRAVHMISPKCRFCMTGTPVANYPRDLLPLLTYVGGDGTVVQPYGKHRPHLEPELLRSMTLAERGVDVFRRRHVVTEWVTHQFEDKLQGAKREVPKVTNLGQLRAWAAPLILRRVATEPDVATYVKTPPHTVAHHVVDWDRGHLAYWLGVADEFSQWYREARRKAGASGIQVNLVALLARIGAVLMAGNYPQHNVKGFPYHGGLTSKQHFVIDRASELSEQGHKTVVFVENPGLAELFTRHLCMGNTPALALTGATGIAERRERLMRFRRSDVPVLCATYGVGGTGLNIPEADRVIFAARTWTTKTENQARYRVLRPQQTRNVVFETVELPGSLDTYQAMMLQFKNDATNAAVDYLEPELEDAEFLHMDTIIDQFVNDLAERSGMSAVDFRRRVRRA